MQHIQNIPKQPRYCVDLLCSASEMFVCTIHTFKNEVMQKSSDELSLCM